MISIDPEVKGTRPDISVAHMTFEKVEVSRHRGPLEDRIRALVSGLEREDDIVSSYRTLYWRFNIDPTKRRVCTESLVRMVEKRGKIPNVNSAVDAVNYLCLKYMIPMSIFDFDKVKPPIILRLAGQDENYQPIGSKIQKIVPGTLVLADAEKVLMAGYASSDCDFTKVTLETENIMVAMYLNESTRARAEKAMKECEELYTTLLTGKTVDKGRVD